MSAATLVIRPQSRSNLAIRPQSGSNAWVLAIVATVLLHGFLIGAGYYRPHDTLLDLIAHGGQVENNPPPLEETVEVTLPPEQAVPEPPPEAAPEFIKPVEAPKVAEVPKPVSTPAPTPEPLATPKPTPAAVVQATPHRTPVVHKPTTVASKPKPINPSVGTGTGDPNFAPSSLVVGNKDFPKPPYPTEARMRHYQGVVVLAIRIANGEVADVSIQSSSGYGILDEAASHWVQMRWRFPKNLTRSLSQRVTFALTS
jgi:TonB family protein